MLTKLFKLKEYKTSLHVEVIAGFTTFLRVGLYMMRRIVEIIFKELEVAVPCFLVIIFVSFTYSISTGLAFGFLFYVVIKSVLGKFREISVTLWIIFVLSCFHLILHNFML